MHESEYNLQQQAIYVMYIALLLDSITIINNSINWYVKTYTWLQDGLDDYYDWLYNTYVEGYGY